MIYVFRKGIKKWNITWWFVLVGLAFGGTSFFFLKEPGRETIQVAAVNGEIVSLKQYHHAFAQLKSSLDDMALYWGVPADRIAKLMGMDNLEEVALKRCIEEKLLDSVGADFGIIFAPETFENALGESVSRRLADSTGKINIQAYQNYLSRLHMGIAEYEVSKEKEFKRDMANDLIKNSYYSFYDTVKNAFLNEIVRKKFSVLVLPYKISLSQVKKEAVSKEQLMEFYQKHKENYRVSEKRNAKYWLLASSDYLDKVVIDEKMIQQFYDKNKTASYRIPPKVKVRTILLNLDSNASPDAISFTRQKIEKIYKSVKEEPDKFAEFAMSHSQDKDSAKNGGLLDFFKRGTYDPELEKTAFIALKNKGEISEIIKTKRGFEIIKLEDRISATEKPLNIVRDSVVETLKNRKALVALRSDLEALIYAARSDSTVFEKFATNNNLKTHITDWLTKTDGSGYEIDNLLAQKLFSEQRKLNKGGYFVYQGKHILYSMIDKQESIIPLFENVIKNVEDDWYAQKAKSLQVQILKRIKQDAFESKNKLGELAKREECKLITTKMIRPDDEVDDLGNVGILFEKAFELSDPSQLLQYKNDEDYYITQLVEIEKVNEDGFTKEKKIQIIDGEESHGKSQYSEAFIASLSRNAKIETNKEMLKVRPFE